MSAFWWAVIVASAAWLGYGGVSSFRRFMRHNEWMVGDWGDLAFNMFGALWFACVISVLGPLPALFRAWAGHTKRNARDVSHILGGTSREDRLKHREDEVRERERRIERLERELGVSA